MIEEISYEEVKNIAGNIHTSADKVKDILSRVENEMKSKVGSGSVWSSAASQEYVNKFNELKGNFDNFYQILVNYSTFLNNTVNAYQRRDEEIKNKTS